jgi:ATP-binding cassette subfamily B protein
LSYTKKYLRIAALALCLVVLQAYCDLELPKYMSNMINVGIRQSGIDDWLPDVFSDATFDEIEAFIPDSDYQTLEKYYVGINLAKGRGWLSQKEYDKYKGKYKSLADGEVYMLRAAIDAEFFAGETLSGEEDAELRRILKAPIIVYAAFSGALSVSTVDFLENKAVLALLWAGYKYDASSELTPEEEAALSAEREAYIKTLWDKPLTFFLSELKAMSDNGEYDESDKASLVRLISAFVGGGGGEEYFDFYDKVISGEMGYEIPRTEEAFAAKLVEAGYSADFSEELASKLFSGGVSFRAGAAIAGPVVNFITESGCVQYKIFEYGKAGADVVKIQINYILKNGVLMLLYTVLGVIAAIMVVRLSARVAAGMAKDLRRDVFKKVQSFSNAEFDEFSTASLITRTSNDISQLHTLFFMLIKNAFYAPLVFFGGLFYVNRFLGIGGNMLGLIAIASAVISVGVIALFFVVLPKFTKIQKLLDKINLVARERLTGLFVIKANDNERAEESRYEDVSQKLMNVNLFINRLMALMSPFMILFMNVLGVIIVYYAVEHDMLIDGSVLPGSLLAFIQYTAQIISAFLLMSGTFVFMPRAAVAMKRIWEVLSAKPRVADIAEPVGLGDKPLSIRFENVSFRYGGASACALENVSFSAPAGKVTAIVGATGSGKSTIINLIMRFYDPTDGTVFVGGEDVKNLSQEELRQNIGYVPQRPLLFSGTIGENLRAAREDASRAELDEAIAVAKAEDFVNDKELNGGGEAVENGGIEPRFSDKYDAPLSEAGKNISGGQKQRLSIARAIVRKPKIYLFDDSFSALDYMTEAALREEIMRQSRENGAGVVIVSQRIASILSADCIIVVDGGRVIGQGTHAELLETCKEYKEIAASQLPKEELRYGR